MQYRSTETWNGGRLCVSRNTWYPFRSIESVQQQQPLRNSGGRTRSVPLHGCQHVPSVRRPATLALTASRMQAAHAIDVDLNGARTIPF